MIDALQYIGELGLGSRLKRLSETLMRETNLIYDAYNIDFDPYLFPVFKILIDNTCVTTTELQEQLQYTQPAITQALNKLSNKKLVVYSTDKVDKRKKNFRLSKKGVELHKELTPIWQAIDQQIKWLTQGSATNLLHHISYIENQLSKKSLSKRVLENL
ncbi:MarR family winged helix-turn-helix transcriptional regulator [Aquimarina intermedia]|uniref:MarR family protein n=1 Tax=Aquimarina intermedia TaxID=350814 RepID=A0A5S5CC32_9FLAO|nr:MarR family transcriptional regulator [Aquimarina intermedia]TYP76062.1 MarR family protein [Aquimarina intermedia]